MKLAPQFSATLALLSALGAAGISSAQAGAILTDSAFSANTLPANDDGSTTSIGLPFGLNFFGTTYNSLYVNNNGNTTFGSPLGTFTPFALTGSHLPPIIAPFFADVDTRGAGSGLVQYGVGTVDGYQAFGVDSIGVGYFPSQTNLLNSFQELLISRPDTGVGNFDIEFNYNQVQWETGSASGGSGGFGGSPAAVGYTAGTGAAGTFFQLPGSLTTRQFEDNAPQSLIGHQQNAPTPTGAGEAATLGRYVFQVRSGNVIPPPPVTTAVPEPSSLGLLGLPLVGLLLVARRRRAA